MTATLKEKYISTYRDELKESGGYKNVMQVPKLDKIVLNIGIDTRQDRNKEVLQSLADELGEITGQRPVLNKAKVSIANYKLREGMPIGAKVTLRGERMYEFMDRLVNVAFPRVRDFRGISPKSFDGRGNYSVGITDQTIFPEINPDKVKKIQGMDITICTTANTDEEGRELLKKFGMPFAS